mgnify:CR=1 FL=1
MTKDEIEIELQAFFKGKQVRFSDHSSSLLSVYDMVYDGKDWITIVARVTVDFSRPVTSLSKIKHELTVILNESFDQHARKIKSLMQEK